MCSVLLIYVSNLLRLTYTTTDSSIITKKTFFLLAIRSNLEAEEQFLDMRMQRFLNANLSTYQQLVIY